MGEKTDTPLDTSTDLWRFCLFVNEESPLPIVAIEGTSHTVSYANPAFCRLIHKPRKQLIGKDFLEMLPNKEKCLMLLDGIYRTGKPKNYTDQETSELNSTTWSYTMWPILSMKRPVAIIIQINETMPLDKKMVTMNEELMIGSVHQHELTQVAYLSNERLQEEVYERKQVEKSLHKAQEKLLDRTGHLQGLVTERTAELTESNSQLKAFIYSIAHDLGAPLRAMQGFSNLLIEEADGALNEKNKGYIDDINKSAKFMSALLNDLLSFSQISQQEMELTAVKLEKVVEQVLLRLQKDIQQKNAQIELGGPWPDVLAHEAALSQVLFNLASNALKFSVPGVPPRMRIRTEEQGDFIRVWVEDNGPGIAPAYQDQVFNPFIRLERDKHEGTGIGLAIVQKGVERMGGRVGVESTVGKGSHFWFELMKS